MNNYSTTMPLSAKTRRSPFFASSHGSGAQSYIVYNHMLLARDFSGAEEDYRHLKSSVQLWDVGCERQIEITGKDAKLLVQMSTPRDLSKMKPDQCFYIPTVDADGFMTNDPVLLCPEPGKYWVSIADSDLLLFYKGLAAGKGLSVEIHEPDVSPLAIQGPKADVLVERIWGKEATELGFFRHKRVNVGGRSMTIARSGYSLQGGYELYFEGHEGADVVWQELMDAGHDLGVRAGCPSNAERIEAGLLSYLNDITTDMTPFEAGLERFCDIDADTACVGLQALRAKRHATRKLKPVRIDGDELPPVTNFWSVTGNSADGLDKPVGRISSAARAYSFDMNVGIGLIDNTHWAPGTRLKVNAEDGPRDAEVLAHFPGRPC